MSNINWGPLLIVPWDLFLLLRMSDNFKRKPFVWPKTSWRLLLWLEKTKKLEKIRLRVNKTWNESFRAAPMTLSQPAGEKFFVLQKFVNNVTDLRLLINQTWGGWLKQSINIIFYLLWNYGQVIARSGVGRGEKLMNNKCQTHFNN